jgi:hypothetical protein
MADIETYRILCNRIAQLMELINAERKKDEYYLTPQEKEMRIGNLQQLLDTNMRAFAMIMNRNFDSKLDYDPELQ